MAQKTVVLTKPVMDAKGAPVKELIVPDPEDITLGQLGILDEAKGDYSRLIYMISAICNLPVSSVRQICFKDLEKINEGFSDFIGENQKGSK